MFTGGTIWISTHGHLGLVTIPRCQARETAHKPGEARGSGRGSGFVDATDWSTSAWCLLGHCHCGTGGQKASKKRRSTPAPLRQVLPEGFPNHCCRAQVSAPARDTRSFSILIALDQLKIKHDVGKCASFEALNASWVGFFGGETKGQPLGSPFDTNPCKL